LPAAGATIGSGLVGAGIGFYFGGPPGAALGFFIGSGLGGLGGAAYGVARHSEDVRQAFTTGMTSLTLRDALADAAFLGLNIAGAGVPIGGAARLVAAGVTKEAIMARLAAAGSRATGPELERLAREELARELANAATQPWARTL